MILIMMNISLGPFQNLEHPDELEDLVEKILKIKSNVFFRLTDVTKSSQTTKVNHSARSAQRCHS